MMIDYFVKQKNSLILFFTVAYLVAFTVNAFIQGNFEFLYYTVLMTALIYAVIFIERHLHLTFFILVNLSILGFLHLLGGNLFIGPTRLYDFDFIPNILRYDNVVHTYGTFIATITLYSLLSNMVDDKIKKNYFIFALMLVLMAIGVGTVNELVEFFAVIFLGAAEQVGGYFNNSLDLFFNTLGSIAACLIIYLYRQETDRRASNEKQP